MRKILLGVMIALFILSFVAMANILILYCYDIKTPVLVSCIITSILVLSLLSIPIICCKEFDNE